MTIKKPGIALVTGVLFLASLSAQKLSAQGLLNLSGSSPMSPAQAPAGGYESDPQEYLTISWTVVETSTGVYDYSYTVGNPSGDMEVNNSGGLTSTPQNFDAYTIDFNTGPALSSLLASISGGSGQAINSQSITWDFNPSVNGGSSSPTVSFQVDYPPTIGAATAQGANGSWTAVSMMNSEILVVPNIALPEPSSLALIALGGLAFLRARKRLGC